VGLGLHRRPRVGQKGPGHLGVQPSLNGPFLGPVDGQGQIFRVKDAGALLDLHGQPLLEVQCDADEQPQVARVGVVSEFLMMTRIVAPGEQGVEVKRDTGWHPLPVTVELLDDHSRLPPGEGLLELAPKPGRQPAEGVLGDQPKLTERFADVTHVPEREHPV